MGTRVIASFLSVVPLLALPAGADVALLSRGEGWRYLDDGSDQGMAWRAPEFDDSSWVEGRAVLGYGDGDVQTKVSFGSNSLVKHVTTYFRRSFDVANPSLFPGAKLLLRRDDGAVVYLNCKEVRRDQMPTNEIRFDTLAASETPSEDEYAETTLSPTALVAGRNVLAVEVHQRSRASSDLLFDLELSGITAESVTRGPYLQIGTPTSVIVRWRTNIATNSRVRFGTDPVNLDNVADDPVLKTEHEVVLSGLLPDTQYFYSVGTCALALEGGSDYKFHTAPPQGTRQPVRVWVVGDSGTKDEGARKVRNAYENFSRNTYTDVWLMLGDNAYDTGRDEEYQKAVFNMYPFRLQQTVLWPAIGNHDTAQQTSVSASLPYFQMFSVPTSGEAGGVASGTEKYYSFDYANVHFICLDSMTSSLDLQPLSPMLTWLKADLEATTAEWIIAYWHHPPYSKGSHDSDGESKLRKMRERVLPILEDGGVDLVLAGHSHAYERSFLIDGHYGMSNTFDKNTMLLNGGGGRDEEPSGAYAKPLGIASRRGAIYVVAGSSGKAEDWANGSTEVINPHPHPVMFVSLLRLGSVVLDISGDRMDVQFLREAGAADASLKDHFTILKNQSPN